MASPVHIPSCNKRFQRRAGSTNRFVSTCKRRRRCLVALSACKQSKIGKQVFCLPSVKCSHRIPVHIPSCNERFQRRAGSANRCVLSFKRGRRCLVALSVWKQLKIGKQVFCFAVGKIFPFASPLHIQSCNKRFQRRAGSANRWSFCCKRGRRYLVALSACGHFKIGKQVFVCRGQSAPMHIPSGYIELQWELPAASWKHQLLRFKLHKRATLPRRPLRLETIKDRQTGVLVAVGKVVPWHPLCIYRVAISASSDELEAPIASFSAVKEGDFASSPSLLINT